MIKKGVRSTPKIFLETDHDVRTFRVSGREVDRIVVAAKNYRLAIPEESFASWIQCATDPLDEDTENLVLDDNDELMEDTEDVVQRVENDNVNFFIQMSYQI